MPVVAPPPPVEAPAEALPPPEPELDEASADEETPVTEPLPPLDDMSVGEAWSAPTLTLSCAESNIPLMLRASVPEVI